jgi:hypothetical protein
LVSWCVKGHLRRLLHRPCCRSSAQVGSRISFLSFFAAQQNAKVHYIHRPVLLRRTKVARRHGVPRPRLLPLLLLHGALPQLGPSSTSSLIGGIGGTRARRRHKAPTPAAEAAGVRVVLLGLRARQTGATIGSILIGSGRTRGAPPRFEVCDVSIIMMSVDSALGRGRAREREGRTVAYPGKVRR